MVVVEENSAHGAVAIEGFALTEPRFFFPVCVDPDILRVFSVTRGNEMIFAKGMFWILS